ncbi:MAG TPA: hypothetical protein VMG12_11410 [Polyangiaceae bacterium]|nr:hypothetical protein [Polyangiaceae bacterium]
MARNPHIECYEGERRGYFAARVTETQLQVDLRFVTSVVDPNRTGYHEPSFVVESGKPGARDAQSRARRGYLAAAGSPSARGTENASHAA